MREIKFRAWNTELKTMTLWDEIQESRFPLFSVFGQGHLAVMQYTGLKDRNGKEIYEGDVLSFNLNTRFGHIDKRGIVRCEAFAYGCTIKFLPHEIDGVPFDYGLEDITIIGNIYENPELLDKP